MADIESLDKSNPLLSRVNPEIILETKKVLDKEKKAKVKKGRSVKSYFDKPKKKTPVKKKVSRKRKSNSKTIVAEQVKIFAKEVKADLKLAAKPTFIDADQLPEKYNKTSVTLIVREPTIIYAFWEIDESSTKKIQDQIGEKFNSGTYTLRVFDVSYVDFNGYNANYWFDLDELYMKKRYVQLQNNNASYLCEIGIRTEDGCFYPFARSNSVTTPRVHISERCDLIWHEVSENKESSTFVKVDINNIKNGARLFPRNNWQNQVNRITLTHEDIINYYSRDVLLSNYLKTKNIQDDSDFKSGPEFNFENQEHLNIEKSFQPALMGKFSKTKKFIGASESLVVREEGASGVGFESHSEKRDDFYFEIDTDLIVRGKTEPGASVYLGSKKLDVKPDGTFSLRYHLPDGIIPLDFTAKSNRNAQKKKVITSVQRTKTQYHKFM
jgi:hypothetical protein